MNRPGFNITLATSGTPNGLAGDISQLFIVGLADKGSTTKPTKVTSMSEFVTKCGARQTYSGLYDALDTFFTGGGQVAWVCRPVGVTPVIASKILQDGAGTPANTMTVKAKSAGAWGNALRITVTVVSSTFSITVVDNGTGLTLETSPYFADKASAYVWSATTAKYIVLSDLSSLLIPAAVSLQALTLGDDDRATVTHTQKLAALNTATADYGPGQVFVCDDPSTQMAQDAALHASTHNRFALPYTANLAAASVASPADAIRDALRTDGTDDYAHLPFASWATTPGVLPNTYRSVPWAIIAAANYARNDALGLGPNAAAAGDQGQTSYPVALTQTDPALDPTTLVADATVAISAGAGSPQVFQTYGDRTCVDPDGAKAVNIGAANARLRMAIVSQTAQILAKYVFKGIDVKGHRIEQCKTDIDGVMGAFYTHEEIYGATAADAWSVVVTPINDPNTANKRLLRAALTYKPTPNSEEVDLTITVVPTTGRVAA